MKLISDEVVAWIEFQKPYIDLAFKALPVVEY